MQPDTVTVEEPFDDYAEWIECWQCGGEGVIESCFEDTCVCLDPPCYAPRCDICRGKGGWPAEQGPHDEA